MKTIIIYSSTYGYTKDCVEKLMEQLQGNVLAVNVMSDTVPSLGEFDNVIIGGSIYMGQIQKKIKVFCSQNMDTILNKRLALFICCGLPENLEQNFINSFPKELLKKAVVKEYFGGELRIDKMNFAHKIITGLMKKVAAKEGKSQPEQMPDNIKGFAEIINCA